MFGKPITLFKILGFSVRMDLSWIVIAVLVTWSLAAGFFPVQFPMEQYPMLTKVTYLWMGIWGMLGLFLSVVFHELCHSLVARKYGLPMKGITLFIFGGVAEMSDEPPSARAEFLMAIAGPASSVLLGGLFYLAAMAGGDAQWPVPFRAILEYLAFINIVLAIFNMLPGFPLDGGRVLRSALWAWKKDLHWATKIAANMGGGFGLILIAMGVLSFIGGNFIGGMWWFLIGMFLRNAATSSYQQLLVRDALRGEPITKFMKSEVISISPEATVEELVDHYVYRYHFKTYPVIENGELAGCVSLSQIKAIPKGQWATTKIRQLLTVCTDLNSIGEQADAMDALTKMSQVQVSRLLVLDGSGHLEGIVSLKDMLSYISMKMELEHVR